MESARERAKHSYAAIVGTRHESVSRGGFTHFAVNIGRHLPADTSIKILDVGCGTGGDLKYMHELGYTDLTGIDLSDDQVAVARELLHGTEIQVLTGDAIEYVSGKDSVGCVLARDVIEHMSLDDAVRFLSACHQALAESGGSVVIQTVNTSSPLSGFFSHGDVTHQLLLNELSIRQISRLAGFGSCQVFESTPTAPSRHIAFMRRFAFGAYRWLIRLAYRVEVGARPAVLSQNLVAVMR